MNEVRWIRLYTDVFDDEKIALIDSMPEADGIIVVWIKLLCLAGKQNRDGVLMLNEKIPYTDTMLATVFRRPIDLVRQALVLFENFGMIEIINDVFCIRNWEARQNIDGLQKIREQTRKRVASHRERKEKAAESVTDRKDELECNDTCNDACNATVTLRNATEKNKNKNKNKNCTHMDGEYNLELDAPAHTHAHEDTPSPTAEDVIHAYNDACVCLPPLRYISEEERSAAEAILQKHTLDQLKEAFCRAEASDLLTARKEGAKWRADFMWIVKEDRIKDILNGKYDSWHKTPAKPTPDKPTPAKDSNSTFDVDEFYERSVGHTYGKEVV